MPDNKNENKFMAMLERRGIVRKAGSEDEQPETESAAVPSRPDIDIREMFNASSSDAPKVTPAARQPVPGMTTPILPSERPQIAEREQPRTQPIEAQVAEPPRIEQPLAVEPQKPEYQRVIEPQKPEYQRAIEPQITEQQPIIAQAAEPAQFAGGSRAYIDNTFPDESYSAPGGHGLSGISQQPQPEDYTDRYLEITELYDALAIRSKRTDTIYLIEEYLKSLPDSLPEDSRREIVGKIVAASGFDYDLLMGDGVLRVKMLKEYAERFANHTDEYIAARQNELDELDRQILRERKLIENRRELHKKQFFTIEAEAQRLKDILSFITG